MWFKNEAESWENFDILDNYVNHNGPRIFTCCDRQQQIFLASWIDEMSEYDRWLYVPLSEERYAQLNAGKIDWREAFLQSETGLVFQVNIFHDNVPDLIQPIACSQLNPNWLPVVDQVESLTVSAN